MAFGLENPVLTLDTGSVVQYDGQRYVAGVNSPTLMAMSNAGAYWKSRTSAADKSWRGVAFAPNVNGAPLFVAVNNNAGTDCVMTSPDGFSWTMRTGITAQGYLSVCYGMGLFVAASVASEGDPNKFMSSPDGITWTASADILAGAFYDICFSPSLGRFVAVSGAGTAAKAVATSDDGLTWTIRSAPDTHLYISCAWGNGVFVAVSYDGYVMSSTDGISWTARTPASNNSWSRVRFGNGLFVAVAYTGTGDRVMTSPDGINWTSRASAADNTWRSLAYGGGVWVAASVDGDRRVMTSLDAITWTLRDAAAAQNWYGAAYGLGRFVFSSNDGTGSRIMTSGGEPTTIIPMGLADANNYKVVATNGQSLVIPDSVMHYVVEPAALIATLTLSMPASPVNGQIVSISAGSFGVTALTLTPNSGQSFATAAAIKSLMPSTGASYIYIQATATWYRVGRMVNDGVVSLTDAATIAVDAALGGVFKLTLTASGHTMGLPSNPVDGQKILFEITQGGSGSYTLSWNAAYQFTTDIPAPTLSTAVGTKDYVGFIYDGASSKWNCLAAAVGYT